MTVRLHLYYCALIVRCRLVVGALTLRVVVLIILLSLVGRASKPGLFCIEVLHFALVSGLLFVFYLENFVVRSTLLVSEGLLSLKILLNICRSF